MNRRRPRWTSERRAALFAGVPAALLAVLLAVGLAVAPSPVRGQADGTRSLTLEAFELTARIEPDADVRIRESITARFQGSWRGLTRDIPLVSRSAAGTVRIGITGLAAWEGSRPLRLERRRDGDELRLRLHVPDAADSTRIVDLDYRVRNGIRRFDDHDEFYWNVTGAQRSVGIGRAEALVLLPPGTTDVRAVAFTGVDGSTASNATVEVEGPQVRVRTTAPLAANEGLTVAVAFPKNVVREPGRLLRAWRWLRDHPVALLPPLTGALLLAAWWKVGRDPAAGAVVTLYEPPADLAPGQAGALIDERVDGRDLAATLVDLAIRGVLAIREAGRSGLLRRPAFELELRRGQQEWNDLRSYERRLLDGLFRQGRAGERIPCRSLDDDRAEALRRSRDDLARSLLDRGCYRIRPARVRNLCTGVGLAIIMAGALPLPPWLALDPRVGHLALPASGVLWILFAPLMPARTLAGARLQRQVRGYEQFIRRVESDRYRRLIRSPEQFEAGLPYAIAFGLNARWSHAFIGLLTAAPAWYVAERSGTGSFDPVRFEGSLESFTSAARDLVSLPRSSSSGGSGFSGGSSGGGSGGGSVGGF